MRTGCDKSADARIMYRMTAMLVLKVAKFTNAYWNTKDVADMGRKRRVGEESKAAFAYSYALETISTCMCVCVCVCVLNSLQGSSHL